MDLSLDAYVASMGHSLRQTTPPLPKQTVFLPEFQYVDTSSEEEEDEGYASAEHYSAAPQIRARDILRRRRQAAPHKTLANRVTKIPWEKRKIYPRRRPHTRSYTCENIWLDPKRKGFICSQPAFNNISMTFEEYLRDWVCSVLRVSCLYTIEN